MESDKFDNLVRGAFKGASRRGVVRVGVGALAASALATMGLRSENVEAKKKKKPVCNCTSSDAATCTTQKLNKNGRNSLLNSNPCAYNGACQAGVSGCPATCTGATPVTCGTGCCPSTFSKCCSGAQGDFPAGTQTCNPTSFNCCPAEQGGGSCGGNHPKCCNATIQAPFGDCAPTAGTCCPSNLGGGHCDADEPVCCPDPDDPNEFGYCCLAGETCCSVDADCPGGGAGACNNGCCMGAPREAGRSRNRTRQGSGERFRMAAS